MSLKPAHSGQMSEAAADSPASQEFVYIDVGGKTFKMLRQTVRNYPDSLLATLLRECPDFGKQEQPVYIDRSPATFEWILEIYRRGDYEATTPRKSAEHLQRELDFYQLPSLAEIRQYIRSPGLTLSADMASKRLMQEIMQEIEDGGMEDMFPWCVYIYHQFCKGESKAKRRVFVIPDAVRLMADFGEIVDFIKGRRHTEFGEMLPTRRTFYLPKSAYCPYQYALDGKTTFALQFPTDELVRMTKEQAQCLGLSIEAKNLESVKSNAASKNVDFTDLPYMHCSFLRKQPRSSGQ